MRVVKLGEGKRRIGEAVVEKEQVHSVREAAVDAWEKHWEPIHGDIPVNERSPITQNEHVVAIPGSVDESVYMYMVVGGQIIKVPDKTYLLKIMQLI